jgi:superoxide dismutase
MKFYTLLLSVFSFFSATAQQSALVVDKENLFSEKEIAAIDSVLQAYHKKSGNLVAVYTDTANISEQHANDAVYALFKKNGIDNALSFTLMMSRNHSLIFSTVNKKTAPFINDKLLMGILEKGFASFKEKRRAEGVLLICSAAMSLLDGLPK